MEYDKIINQIKENIINNNYKFNINKDDILSFCKYGLAKELNLTINDSICYIIAYIFGNYNNKTNTIILNNIFITDFEYDLLLQYNNTPCYLGYLNNQNDNSSYFIFNCKDCNQCNMCINCNQCNNCINCYNCNNCVGSTHCTNSLNCNYSEMCNECMNIDFCVECTQCTNCYNLYACSDCYKCDICQICVNCMDCRECDNCTNCKGYIFECYKCSECIDCIDCQKCIKCANCVDCNNLQECEICVNCHDCINCVYCLSSNMCVECIACLYCSNCDDCKYLYTLSDISNISGRYELIDYDNSKHINNINNGNRIEAIQIYDSIYYGDIWNKDNEIIYTGTFINTEDDINNLTLLYGTLKLSVIVTGFLGTTINKFNEDNIIITGDLYNLNKAFIASKTLDDTFNIFINNILTK